MIADLPPIPTCVEKAEQVEAQILLFSGKQKEVVDFVREVDKPDRTYSLGATVSDRARRMTITFRFPPEVPYRTIGGLIFSAQVHKLSVEWLSEPPLCTGTDEKN